MKWSVTFWLCEFADSWKKIRGFVIWFAMMDHVTEFDVAFVDISWRWMSGLPANRTSSTKRHRQTVLLQLCKRGGTKKRLYVRNPQIWSKQKNTGNDRLWWIKFRWIRFFIFFMIEVQRFPATTAAASRTAYASSASHYEQKIGLVLIESWGHPSTS